MQSYKKNRNFAPTLRNIHRKMNLSKLKIGETARIKSVGGEGSLRHHFLDMGLVPGTNVTLKKLAPMGDPMQFELYGYALTLRREDAEKILVS